MDKTTADILAEVMVEASIDAIRKTMEGKDLDVLAEDSRFIVSHATILKHLFGFDEIQCGRILAIAFTRERRARAEAQEEAQEEASAVEWEVSNMFVETAIDTVRDCIRERVGDGTLEELASNQVFTSAMIIGTMSVLSVDEEHARTLVAIAFSREEKSRIEAQSRLQRLWTSVKNFVKF